jgi:hypothetical protein
MVFSIKLLLDPVSDIEPNGTARLGLIEMGSFQERFKASLTYWNADNYQRHWRQAVARIIQSSTTSCLISSMYNPTNANFIVWYPMYRVGDTVFIQNQILFLDELPLPFNENDPFSSIPERRTISDGGELLSEWSVPLEDLKTFLLSDLPPPSNE